MKYYPAFLDLRDRPCLVIGGGRVAEQKVGPLLAAGARLMVISPKLTGGLQALDDAGRFTYEARCYRRGDLNGFVLAIAATQDEGVHQEIADEARKLGVMLNVVDRPLLCNFIVPAMVQRGDLLIAISTSGTSPRLASRIRQQLEGEFGPEYAPTLRVLAQLRQRLATAKLPAEDRRRILTAVVDGDLVQHVRRADTEAIDRLLARSTGENLSLAQLGVDLDVASPTAT